MTRRTLLQQAIQLFAGTVLAQTPLAGKLFKAEAPKPLYLIGMDVASDQPSFAVVTRWFRGDYAIRLLDFYAIENR
jgi:hypothetical protein